MNCTLCYTPLNTKVDEEYYICHTCNAYLKDEMLYFDQDKEKSHYECHNNDVNDIGYQHFTAPVTNTVLAHCTPDMLGLDYGCGKGPVITKRLVEQGYTVDLYDPFFHPNLTYLDKVYDYIFSCEVFEHFYTPYKEIDKLTKILKQGGLLIIKTHLFTEQTDFKNWYYRKDQTHVFIYTFKTIEYLAKQFDYQIETLTEKLVVLRKK